jgi:hypothetical protein
MFRLLSFGFYNVYWTLVFLEVMSCSLLVRYLISHIILMMNEASLPEMQMFIYKTTRRHIPESSTINIYRCIYLKPYLVMSVSILQK